MNEHRSSYRKNLKVNGMMVSNDRPFSDAAIPFFTKNVSLKGFQACISDSRHLEDRPLVKGDMFFVRLPMLKLEGFASMMWMQMDKDGLFHSGFKFMNMRGVEGSTFHYRASDLEASVE